MARVGLVPEYSLAGGLNKKLFAVLIMRDRPTHPVAASNRWRTSTQASSSAATCRSSRRSAGCAALPPGTAAGPRSARHVGGQANPRSFALYVAHRGEQTPGKVWKVVVRNDFADFRKAGLTAPRMDEIEKALQAPR